MLQRFAAHSDSRIGVFQLIDLIGRGGRARCTVEESANPI
jgi:hypothetical protein